MNNDFIYCRKCNKKLTKDMEIEYSMLLDDYFCCPDCAMNYYFEYMDSRPFDMHDGNEIIIDSNGFLKENESK